MTNADVIVVGAGIGGLQLAALLASDGDRVQVLEKLGHVGGRAAVWDKDGFSVDNGIHLIRFGPKSATAKVFRHIGREIEFVPLGKSYARLRDGRVVDFPTDPKGFLLTTMMSKRERAKALSIMAQLRAADYAGRLPWLAEAANRLPLPRRLAALHAEGLLATPVVDWFENLGIRGGLRRYFQLVSASMQVCPNLDRASAGELLFNLQAVLEKGISATYPRRGWQGIFDDLVQVISQRGEVRTECKVSRVIVEEGITRGVELASGERLTAGTVVVSLPCQQIFDILDESLLPKDFVTTCKQLIPTCGVVLDYGLSRRISEDRGLWYLEEPTSFGIFTSNLCPRLAPSGKQLLTWLQPASPEEIADKRRAKRLEKRLETTLFQTFAGLEDAVEWRRAKSLAVVDGVEVNVSQHRRRRPRTRAPGLRGLFFVGDSLAGGGAGGDVGHESVLACYREMTNRPV